MNYADNKIILKTFYDMRGLSSIFENDSVYLEKTFNDSNKIWTETNRGKLLGSELKVK